MEGIVLELQRKALSQESDILQLLREAYLISCKLQRDDFKHWANLEMNGYPPEADIPSYRLVHGTIKVMGARGKWVPVSLDAEDADLCIHGMPDTIASLFDMYKRAASSNVVGILFPVEKNRLFQAMFDMPAQFALHVSANQIFNIFERVRTEILNWTLMLEKNGIIGEGLRFSDEEKAIARSIPVINQYTNNFFGSVNTAQIQQGGDNDMQ